MRYRAAILAAFCLVAITAGFAHSSPAHADAHHNAVWTGIVDGHGDQIYYIENKNNDASGGPNNARVFISAWDTGTGTNDLWTPPDIYGTMIWSVRPGTILDPILGDPRCGALPWCWLLDGAQAAGFSSQTTADENSKPCGFVLWYAWDWSRGPISASNPLFGGTFC